MRGALVHIMPPSAAPERRRRTGLRILLFGAGAGIVLVTGALLLGVDAMSAVSVPRIESWRVLAPSSGKPEIADAIPAGQETELPLYACRVAVGQDMHVGRIRSDFGGCHIGFGGKEAELGPAETLAATWRAGADSLQEGFQGALGAGAERATLAGGSFAMDRLYLCRARHQGGIHPGQIRSGERECSFGFGGRRVTSVMFDVLQGASWMHWAPTTARLLPDTAIVAGSEGGETFFACRAADRGGLHPGKVKRNGAGCSIVSDNREVIVDRFEILATRWLTGHAGTVPIAAVPVGWEGASLQYVCRARTRDSVQVGKVSDSLGGCHVGMLGREVVMADYEVLSQ